MPRAQVIYLKGLSQVDNIEQIRIQTRPPPNPSDTLDDLFYVPDIVKLYDTGQWLGTAIHYPCLQRYTGCNKV